MSQKRGEELYKLIPPKSGQNGYNIEVNEKEWNVPEEYLGIPLDKKKKEELIEKIHFPKKWNSLKKYLLEHNYKIEEKNSGGIRASIITV